ncbi:MAG: HAD-IG family 5'-nucleotidase [Candidatus Riflebacteria bacterium]|nr:HAD-IG family 5'-nucleotidase [Candidatus Riflebacteria bacterium]
MTLENKQSNAISAGKLVFVNRTLNMNHIKLVGFDMDYTLATYNVLAFEDLAYQFMIEKLVTERGYPEAIRKLKFNRDFIIRGLVIDTELGNLMKVNCYGYLKKTTHGTRFLEIGEHKKIYTAPAIDLTDPRFYIIHTLFSLAEGCLFAQLVDFIDAEKLQMNLKKVFNDIRACLDDVHQEGKLKGIVLSEPQKYLKRNPEIAEALMRFKKCGKKLAMITNSDYDYSQKVMQYCFGEMLPGPWQDLFDLIIVASDKPSFFQNNNKFLKVDRKTALLANFHEPIRFGQIYQGGNARALERDLKLSPSEILYIGDHIYGDVVTLKKAIGWRTGLIVQELETEVPSLEAHQEQLRALSQKMREKEELEDQQFELKEIVFSSPERREELDKTRDELRHKIEKLDEALSILIRESQQDFNPYWGEIMRAGNEESRLATLVEKYACIYMSSVGNLARYSPFKYFRPRRRFLAHDPQPFEERDAFSVEDLPL